MFNSLEQSRAEFGTTNWSLVAGLRADDGQLRRRTAEWVTATYWPAVYACARHMTESREDACDLTQGFFADVVLGRGLLEPAVEERGRLRSLIRAALRRYAVDNWRRQKARGAAQTLHLHDLDREDQMLNGVSADDEFDRRWALSVLERALSLCEWHYREAKRDAHWTLFERRVVHPALRGLEAPSMTSLAAQLGFETQQQASAALQTVKRKLAVTLRQAVAETVEERSETEEERRYLLALLGMDGEGATL